MDNKKHQLVSIQGCNFGGTWDHKKKKLVGVSTVKLGLNMYDTKLKIPLQKTSLEEHHTHLDEHLGPLYEAS